MSSSSGQLGSGTQVVILAGGRGTRLTEESQFRPKPMIEIGQHPIIWHIMKIFSHYGLHDFIVCCGYRGDVIKRYFSDYFVLNSDITFDLASNTLEIHQKSRDPWRVTVVDTGLDTKTGGRLKRIRPYLNGKPFCMTYGDGLANIDISALMSFHKSHGKLATMTAIQGVGRYGAAVLGADDAVVKFNEKPKDGAWINGGYFVIDPAALDLVEGDETQWELEPLTRLTQDSQLSAFRHEGFWMAMDHLREKIELEKMWEEGRAPWKVWV